MFCWDCYNGVCKDEDCKEELIKIKSNLKGWNWIRCETCNSIVNANYYIKHIGTRKHNRNFQLNKLKNKE